MSHRTVFAVTVLCVIVITSVVKALDTDKERLKRLLEKIDNTNLTKDEVVGMISDFLKSGRTLDTPSGLSNMNGTVASSNESRKSDLKKNSTSGGADLVSARDGKNESSLFAIENSLLSDENDIAEIKAELQVLFDKISALDTLIPPADENKKQNTGWLSEDSGGNNGISTESGGPMSVNSKYNGTTVDGVDSKDIAGKNEDETKQEGNEDIAEKGEHGNKPEENKALAGENEDEKLEVDKDIPEKDEDEKLEVNKDIPEKDENASKLEENKALAGENEDEKLEVNKDIPEKDEDEKLEVNKDIPEKDEDEKLEVNKDIPEKDEDEKLEVNKDIPEKDEDVNKLEENKDKGGEDETTTPHVVTNTASSTGKSSSRKSTSPPPEVDPVPIKKMDTSSSPGLLLPAMILVALFAVTYVVYKRRRMIYIWIFENDQKQRRRGYASSYKYKSLPTSVKRATQ